QIRVCASLPGLFLAHFPEAQLGGGRGGEKTTAAAGAIASSSSSPHPSQPPPKKSSPPGTRVRILPPAAKPEQPPETLCSEAGGDAPLVAQEGRLRSLNGGRPGLRGGYVTVYPVYTIIQYINIGHESRWQISKLPFAKNRFFLKALMDELIHECTLFFLPVLLSEKEFHDAAKRNDTVRMEELVKRGVDIRAKNNIDRTALHWAAGAGNEQANGHNLLHCAAQRGHLKVIEFIMEDLEDVRLDKKDKMDRTAFHLAAGNGQLEVVEFLVASGCTRNVKDKKEFTNCPNCWVSLPRIYGGYYTDLQEKNTALHLAAKNGHAQVLQKLIEIGMDLDEENIKKMTCLHYAALNGCEDMARVLINAGIQTDALNYQNASAMHIAVLHNHPTVVKLLIDAECDLDIPDNQGKTSLDIAARGNHINLADMIIKADRFYKWEKDNLNSDSDSWVAKHLTFKQDHQLETQHIRSVIEHPETGERRFSFSEEVYSDVISEKVTGIPVFIITSRL
ncbi:hypothetical protein JD844_014658, partial [Phrynosoma platyrhinos]